MLNKIKHRAGVEEIISIADKVKFLKQPAAYPFEVNAVETKETHMSWVFLAGSFVYKLKKPVNYPFLDLRSLSSRLRNCEEEMRLNKRLAPGIYLELVPLTADEEGKLTLKGRGSIVDWLVRMKRIPDECMLDHAIRAQNIPVARLKKAAALLVGFYKNSLAVEISPGQYRERLKDGITSTFDELSQAAYDLPIQLTGRIRAAMTDFLNRNSLLFDERAAQGKIIEAHGDLRPEHISLDTETAIIDCLEFSRELRIMDTAEELSFLALECEMLGDSSTGKIFFDTYFAMTGDHIPESLINFYKIKKACLRAVLVARHIKEAAYKEDPKWLRKANAYLQLADQYCRRLSS